METTQAEQSTTTPTGKHRWNFESARKAAAISAANRAARKANPSAFPPPPPQAVQTFQPIERDADSYELKQRDKIRARVDDLLKRLERERDASKADRLASAIAKLSDLERIMDGRPLPGAFRPVERRAKSTSSGPVMPLE